MRSLSNGLRLKEEIKEEIIDNVLIGISMKENDLPKLPKKRKLPHGTNSRVSLLKILLNSVSEKYDVAQKLIASTQDIKTLKGWRYELFGKKALEFKNGKIAIIMNNNNIELKEL